MKGWVLILLILIAPFAYAEVISTGNYYSGTTFDLSGGTYGVVGVEPVRFYNNDTDNIELYYRSMIIQSNVDDTVIIRNGTCHSTRLYKYCYTTNTIDMKNMRTFQGDYLESVMELTISTLDQPLASVSITRPQSEDFYCGQSLTIPIIITNDGQLGTNITYVEQLPLKILVTDTQGGDVSENAITFRDTLGGNISRNYSYTIDDLDCQTKIWSGQYSYDAPNGTVVKTLDNLTLYAKDSYIIDHSVSIKNNDPKALSTYVFNITNTNPHSAVNAEIYFDVPMEVAQVSGNIRKVSDASYVYDTASVAYNTTDTAYIKFRTNAYGEYSISASGKIQVGVRYFDYAASTPVITINNTVQAFIDVDPNKTSNNTIHIRVGLTNNDVINKYYNIYAIFKDTGEEPLSYNNITADTSVIILERSYNLVNKTNLSVIIDGVYRDYYGNEYKLHAEKFLFKNMVIDINNAQANTNPVVNQINTSTIPNSTTVQANKNGSNDTSIVVQAEKKDFISSIIENFSRFLQSLFTSS